MRPPSFLVVASAFLAALATAGCTGGDDAGQAPLPAEWRGRDLREPGWQNETIPSGMSLELTYTWSAGQRVSWDWFVYGPVYQEFHVTADADPSRHMVTKYAQEDQYDVTIPAYDTYRVAWSNLNDEDVRLAFNFPAGYAARVGPPRGCLATADGPTDLCGIALPDLPRLPPVHGPS